MSNAGYSTSRVASFDIGKNNFAFCVEEFLVPIVPIHTSPHVPPSKKRYCCVSKKPTPEFESILNDVYRNGTVVLFKNIDLVRESMESRSVTREEVSLRDVTLSMNRILDRYSEYWDTCCCILVEQQMGFGNKQNTMAIKLGQNCQSYFGFVYGNFKEVCEFPAYHKTRILGFTRTVGRSDKTDRKKWSSVKAAEILELRGDAANLSVLSVAKKRDDLGDVICQLQAFKVMRYLDGTI